MPFVYSDTATWTQIKPDAQHRRLSHASTQVGSYLFITGGHDGTEYLSDLLLFNLGMSSILYYIYPSADQRVPQLQSPFNSSLDP